MEGQVSHLSYKCVVRSCKKYVLSFSNEGGHHEGWTSSLAHSLYMSRIFYQQRNHSLEAVHRTD